MLRPYGWGAGMKILQQSVCGYAGGLLCFDRIQRRASRIGNQV